EVAAHLRAGLAPDDLVVVRPRTEIRPGDRSLDAAANVLRPERRTIRVADPAPQPERVLTPSVRRCRKGRGEIRDEARTRPAAHPAESSEPVAEQDQELPFVG